MASPASELTLLREVVPTFLDVARFYCSQDPRATKARLLVNEQHGREKAFHGSVYTELRLLLETLSSLPPTIDQELMVQEPIQDLLHVLEDHFVRSVKPETTDCVSSVNLRICRELTLTSTSEDYT